MNRPARVTASFHLLFAACVLSVACEAPTTAPPTGNEGQGQGNGEDCAADTDCDDGQVCASFTELSLERFCRAPALRGERCGGFDGDGTLAVACSGDLVCTPDPTAIVEEEICVPLTGREVDEPCLADADCLSGECLTGERCVAADCTTDTDCDAGLVCRVTSCDGNTCVAPATEGARCDGAEGTCTIRHPCGEALTCTAEGLCN